MTTDPFPRVQQNLNAYWTDRAAAYDDYQQRPERLLLDQAAWSDIWRGALPRPPANVLDLGTGTGYIALLLAGLGYDVTATDLSDGMLVRARKHAARTARPPRFQPGDAVTPNFAEASFDAITNRYLMWTLREPARALANWRRLLRPGGVLAVVDSAWFPRGLDVDAAADFGRWYDGEVQRALPLATARSIDEVRDLVLAAGFRDVTVTPLTSVLELDRQYGVAPRHEVRLQHLVRGVRPIERLW